MCITSSNDKHFWNADNPFLPSEAKGNDTNIGFMDEGRVVNAQKSVCLGSS